MEFLRFVLSSFWAWLGFVVLIAAAGEAVAGIIRAVHPARKIAVYRAGDVVRVEVEGASRGDIETAVEQVKKAEVFSGAWGNTAESDGENT